MHNNLNILLVDNNIERRNIIRQMLHTLNHYQYIIQEAMVSDLAYFTHTHIKTDLIILGMNVLESERGEGLQHCNSHFAGVPVIVISKNSDEKIIFKLLKGGVKDYLVLGKFNSADLYKAISFSYERSDLDSRLRQSQAFFHATLDALTASVAVLDETGRIIFVNKQWRSFAVENRLGWSDNGVGRNYLEISDLSFDTEGVGRAVAAEIRNILNGKSTYAQFEYDCHSPEQQRWFSLTLSCFTELGKIRIVAAHDNITEKKLDQQHIQKSDLIFQYSIDMLCIAGYDGYFKVLNPAWSNTLGWSSEELLAKPWIEFVHPEDVAKTIAIKERIVTGEKILRFENRYRCKNGSYKWLAWNSFPYDKENIMFGVARDITEQRVKEEQIKILSSAVEQSPHGVVITDNQGNIKYINPQFSVLTGFTHEEVIGKNPRIFQAGTKSREEYENLWNTILSGQVWFGEFLNRKKSGELYWEQASIAPITNPEGQITHFIGIKKDITEMRNMVNELIAAKEKAEEMSRVKSAFFANMSHEIRTPFVGIMGFAEILADVIEDVEYRTMAEGIVKSARRMQETLTKILNMANLESQNIALISRKVDTKPIFYQIIKEYREAAIKKRILLSLNYLSQNEQIETEETLLYEIIKNLVSNGIIFTRQGNVTITVTDTIRDEHTMLKISVKDTGIGIPFDKQDIIWQEFRQVSEGSNRIYEGTGLGLSIVKKYTELLGGSIQLVSAPEVGSEFIIEIPMVSGKKETTTQGMKKPDNNPTLTKKRILYVEDDNIGVLIVKSALAGMYEIDSAHNHLDAISLAERKVYDAVLIDINLGPGLSGIEFADTLRLFPGYTHTPFIAVTAYAGIEDKHTILASGIDYYLSKPFKLKQLRDLLREVLER